MKKILFLSLFLMSSIFASSKSSAQELRIDGAHVSSEVSDDEEEIPDIEKNTPYHEAVLNQRKQADFLEKNMTVEEKATAALRAFFYHISQPDCDEYIESFFSVFGKKYLESDLLLLEEKKLMFYAYQWYETIK